MRATDRTLTRLLPAMIALLVLAGSSAAAAQPMAGSSIAAATSPTATVRRVALGVSMLPYGDLAVVDQFTADAGRAPAAWTVWSDWGGPDAAFPTALMQGLRDRGITPIVIWQPVDPSNINSPAYRYRRIVNGAHDAYIREWAQAADDFGGTVVLRFAHEMDGFWFPWGMGRFDNTPARFKAAWRHIWNIVRGPGGAGATNVKFLWSPTSPASDRPSFASLYPGDGYVDYVGFTSFNWNRRGIPWKSMVSLYTSSMTALGKITKKPVIVAETGSTSKGGDKAAWIRTGYPAVYSKWKRIRSIIYFNVDMPTQNRDWRLTTPMSAMDAYRSIAAQARFQGRFR